MRIFENVIIFSNLRLKSYSLLFFNKYEFWFAGMQNNDKNVIFCDHMKGKMCITVYALLNVKS